jgi:RNA polymerase sigma-70 factor, ECF subfamily
LQNSELGTVPHILSDLDRARNTDRMRTPFPNDIRRELIDLLPRLRRFAYALTGDSHHGDDIIQEACARAIAHIDQFQPGTRLDHWMYRIVRNIWLNQERALKVRGRVIDLDAAPEPVGEDGRHVTEMRLTLRQVLQALAKLPRDQQELIALVCIEGLSYQHAADILPLGTATSRLARARRRLYAAVIEGAEHDHDEVH